MKALVKTKEGPGNLELMDWKEPNMGADDILIEVAYAGICGTDLHILKGEWKCNVPVILGHEFCGKIVDVGSNIKEFKSGEKVVAGNPAETCGACYHCRSGNSFMCRNRVSMGYMIDGGFAKYITVRKGCVHKIPSNVTIEEAALCEPLSVAVRAMMERINIHAGDNVLISGTGTVGLLCMAIAKAEWAVTYLCGKNIDELRLNCGKILGSNFVVNIDKEDIQKIISEQTMSEGVDIAVECAGAPASLKTCFQNLRKEGTLVQVGIYSGPFELDFSKIVMNELQVLGVYGYVWSTWEKSLALLKDKKIDVKPLITHKYPISKWKEAFDTTQNGSGIKVLLQPE